jgi:predicted hydrocarbon binding protein/KaiC/GvpD/RAD55 family RecA-like ATPase
VYSYGRPLLRMGVQVSDHMVSLAQLQEVPSKNMILLVGPPGSGKTTFSQQVILQNLAMDRPVIYVITEHNASEAERALRERGLGEIEAGLLNFVDAYSETVGLSITDRPDTVTADCASLSSIGIAISKLQDQIRKKDVLLVFDSLTSPYLLSGPEVVRFIRLTLSRLTGEGNSVISCFDEGSGKEEDLVGMMSLANSVIKLEVEKDKQFLEVVKHPNVTPTRIEVPIEPEQLGIVKRVWNPSLLKQYFQAFYGGKKAFWRREVGDYVNLFWPKLALWSGLLWGPKRFPRIFYEANKDDMPAGMKTALEDKEVYRAFAEVAGGPLRMRLFTKLMPKSFSKVKDVKKMGQFWSMAKLERSGIQEYLEDRSKTDEHYFRVYENFDCWGFENIGAPMASYLTPITAGAAKGLEILKGLDRDWNAVETKCIGLGDPYCEIKLVPGELDELKPSLEKDVSVLERIHDSMMDRLMGFLLDGKPLVETRPRLGSDVYLHPVSHTMGGENIPAMSRVWRERYQMAMRMGGAKVGKEVGEHLMEAGIRENDAVRLMVHLLEHCKVGKVTVNETIRIKENCENALTKVMQILKDPSCYFTTGFLNGFFSAVKNQHVKETKCIAMGDPYCEWEFR